MRIKQLNKLVTAAIGDFNLAESDRALKLQEAGFDLYDPVYYFPREEVNMKLLKKSDHSTHCPLKGDTEYFDIQLDHITLEKAAFSYVTTHDGGEELKDLIAFDQEKVQIVEHVENE
jgi:uncharacterized protein (DUF427 family)